MAASIRVWWGSGSQPAWKVLIALQEKKLPYESNLIEFSKKEHKTPEFLQMNPRGKVPTVKIDDFYMYESGAIIQFLEYKYPQNPLLPADDKLKALTLQRVAEVDYVGESMEGFYPFIFGRKKLDTDRKDYDEAVAKLKEELSFWDKNILRSDGFIVGDQVTLADCAFFPLIASLERWGIACKSFPNIYGYKQRMAARDSVKNTFPPHWKTTTPPLTLEDI